MPAGVVALVPDSQEASPALEPVAAGLPAPSNDRIWLRLRNATSNEQLAERLSVPEERLAQLNDVNEDHRYDAGDWLVIPSKAESSIAKVLVLDPASARRTPPLEAPPPAEDSPVVRFGDTVFKIAQRYGMTLTDLLRLNPGLETARLVVGSPIRLAQSSSLRPRMVLGLRPSASGGLSWPEMPGFGSEQNPNDALKSSPAGWIWPTRGMFTSGYGWRWGRMHKGIDIANNVGTTVVAAKAGRVSFAGWHDGGYGYLVTLQHEDGSRSLYAHNSRLLVRDGEEVRQGQSISQMGSTGRSTGPHLHFEIHPAQKGAANPLTFLPPRA
ncbi:MAG: peptidoglycan DD-metalloendopeptidase family protein [Cyanobacteriota bacterium]|nr:peptidoglycan DD-metalloendopeptidase family protein [Cyanobacteriota bacterium]